MGFRLCFSLAIKDTQAKKLPGKGKAKKAEDKIPKPEVRTSVPYASSYLFSDTFQTSGPGYVAIQVLDLGPFQGVGNTFE